MGICSGPLVFIPLKNRTVRRAEGLLKACHVQCFDKIFACDHGQQ